MDHRLIGRINASVLALGVLFSFATLLAFGVDAALGAAIGATVGFANWRLLKWIIERVTRPRGDKGQPVFVAVLVLKMGALMGVSWLLMAKLDVHPGGFAIGIGALVVGMLVGALAEGSANGSSDDPSLDSVFQSASRADSVSEVAGGEG